METMTRFEVECQDNDRASVRHEAAFAYVNEFGQRVYKVVCDCDPSGVWYDATYTEEVVHEVGAVYYGETPDDLDLAPREEHPAEVYVDPFPGRKGSERVYETCWKCDGAGSVSWGVNLSAVVNGREVPKVCFDCNGVGQTSRLVSSARATERARVKRAKEARLAAEKFVAEREAREAEEAAALDAWKAAHADVVEAVAALSGEFGLSLREALADGPLTERQVEAVRRIAAERAADPEPAPVVEGRGVVTGRILSRKWVDSPYGSGALKVTVLDDRGFKVYGTLPAAIDDAQKGDRVTFTAAVTVSGDDETFGFFKRPSKAARA